MSIGDYSVFFDGDESGLGPLFSHWHVRLGHLESKQQRIYTFDNEEGARAKLATYVGEPRWWADADIYECTQVECSPGRVV